VKEIPTAKDPLEPATISHDWATLGPDITGATVFTNPTLTIEIAPGGAADSAAAAMPTGTSQLPSGSTVQRQRIDDGVDGANYVAIWAVDTNNPDHPHPVERVLLRVRTDRP
jgi:hypothetical protein